MQRWQSTKLFTFISRDQIYQKCTYTCTYATQQTNWQRSLHRFPRRNSIKMTKNKFSCRLILSKVFLEMDFSKYGGIRVLFWRPFAQAQSSSGLNFLSFEFCFYGDVTSDHFSIIISQWTRLFCSDVMLWHVISKQKHTWCVRSFRLADKTKASCKCFIFFAVLHRDGRVKRASHDKSVRYGCWVCQRPS